MARIYRRVILNGLNDLDNHNGVVPHLESDILECGIKRVSGSINANKASGDDGIPDELFQIIKTMMLKCCNQYVSKFGKLRIGHRTGKVQFSFQSQIKAVPKNVSVTAQMCSFCMLVRLCSKSFKLGLSST